MLVMLPWPADVEDARIAVLFEGRTPQLACGSR
jgi:hypothetical protein